MTWLSSWQGLAASEFAPALQLPDWHAHAKPGGVAPAEWWKEVVVRGHLARGRQVVWVDDDIEARADLEGLRARWPGQLHTICPQPERGVLVEELGPVVSALVRP